MAEQIIERPSVTQGNIASMKATLTRDNEAFPVADADNVAIALVSGLGRKTVIAPEDYEISMVEEGVIYVDGPATLAPGCYGLEVMGTLNDTPWRTYTASALVVTYPTVAGGGTATATGDRIDITMDVQMYSMSMRTIDGIQQAIDECEAAADSANGAAQAANAAAQGADEAKEAVEETEHQVATAEAARVLAEQGRVNAEAGRAQAEESRVGAEQGRVTAELARVQAEQGRVQAEQARIAAEEQRIANEQARISTEETRQAGEQQRISQEEARVREFARLKTESEAATDAATSAANTANASAQNADEKAALAQAAATLANAKAQLAADKAALAQAAAILANDKAQLAEDKAQLAEDKAALAQQKADYAQTQGNYAQTQGDYAKEQGDYAKEQGETVEPDHQRAESDHTRAENDHTASATATAAASQAATAANQAATAANNAAAAAAQATEEMEGDIQTLIENTDAVLGADDIPQFDVTETYAIGDFVMYNGKLYKFLAGHAPGAWNPQEVQQTNLVYEVNSMVKSDYEVVIIDLKNEDNDPMSNVEVVVKVEGEQSGRNLITDAQGRCTTNVQRGLEYTVDVNTPAGYQHTGQIWHRASLPTRLISIILLEDTSSQYEHLQVTLSYSDSSLGVADHIIVSYDGVDYSAPVVNNVAEFDIPLGKTYTVSFPDIEGYVTPRSRTRVAEFGRTYELHIWYHAAIAGIRWLMNDGSEKELNEATLGDYNNIFGLIVNVSELANANTGYILPLDVMVNGGGSGNWLSANEGIDSMENFTSHAAVLTDLDGEQNCQKIRDHIAYQAAVGITRTSGIAQTVYNRCGGVGVTAFATNVDYAVGDLVSYQNKIYRFTSAHKGNWNAAHVEEYGVGYIMPSGELQRCFQVAYGQIYPYRVVFQQVRDFMATTFGVTPVNVASGYWWTSTQYSDTNGAMLGNGGFYSTFKAGSGGTLLPALAY